MCKKRKRILMCRFHLDGHDRGLLTVMHALKNAGIEVIYVHFSHPREILKSAIQEDVDAIGISSSLGQHLLIASLLLEELRKNEVNVPVIMGGIIPSVDVPKLLDIGVRQCFGPGSTPKEAVSFISKNVT